MPSLSFICQDGKHLIYYIAAVVVVFDYEANTQKFFTKHNDDVTTICLSPTKTWCASGQKDPKDEPGKGKDLPKIYVWYVVSFGFNLFPEVYQNTTCTAMVYILYISGIIRYTLHCPLY